MQINVKAGLLSAFVLPGLGQLYKGCKVKGVILIAFVNLFLIGALAVAMQGLGKIALSSRIPGAPDTAKLLETMRNDTPAARWLLALFFGLWLYGVVDAFIEKNR